MTFTPSERVELAAAIKRRYGNRQGQRTDQLPENIPEYHGEETRRIAAKEAGFGSETTYRQAKGQTNLWKIFHKLKAA